MSIAIALIIIILVASLVGTFIVTSREDVKYGESTKRNTVNLSIIYVIMFIVFTIGTVWFIVSAIS
jgi:cytochrome c biogenesis protein ResB